MSTLVNASERKVPSFRQNLDWKNTQIESLDLFESGLRYTVLWIYELRMYKYDCELIQRDKIH